LRDLLPNGITSLEVLLSFCLHVWCIAEEAILIHSNPSYYYFQTILKVIWSYAALSADDLAPKDTFYVPTFYEKMYIIL
jgi:hypothetical protein